MPGDACTGADMATEEGHGIRYIYGQRIHLDHLGSYAWIYVCVIVLGSHELCLISLLCREQVVRRLPVDKLVAKYILTFLILFHF